MACSTLLRPIFIVIYVGQAYKHLFHQYMRDTRGDTRSARMANPKTPNTLSCLRTFYSHLDGEVSMGPPASVIYVVQA